MSLDKAFADLIAALNANTAALLKGGSAAPAAPNKPAPAAAPAAKAPTAPAAKAPTAPAAKAPATPKPAPAPAPAEEGGEVTLADLRNIGKQLIAAKKQPEMRALIAEYGAESLTTLDPQHFAAIKPRLEALLSGEGAPAEEAAGDGL